MASKNGVNFLVGPAIILGAILLFVFGRQNDVLCASAVFVLLAGLILLGLSANCWLFEKNKRVKRKMGMK